MDWNTIHTDTVTETSCIISVQKDNNNINSNSLII